MRLIFTIGWQTMAVPVTSDIDIATLIKGLSAARAYETKGYGSDQTYTVQEDYDLQIKLVDDSRFADGDAPAGYFAKVEELTKRAEAADRERHQTQRQLDGLKKKIEAAGLSFDEPPNAKTAEEIPF